MVICLLKVSPIMLSFCVDAIYKLVSAFKLIGICWVCLGPFLLSNTASGDA